MPHQPKEIVELAIHSIDDILHKTHRGIFGITEKHKDSGEVRTALISSLVNLEVSSAELKALLSEMIRNENAKPR